MKRLIVIEGFDRCGKDTLLADIENSVKGCYILKNDLVGIPKYDKEKTKFLDWLNRFIIVQIEEINKAFDTYDTVIMVRFLVSDNVYSKLFNREKTVEKLLYKLRPDVEISTFCLLFKTYDDYLNRLYSIGDNDIQYSEGAFKKINDLYVENTINGLNVFICYDTTREWIKKMFINNYKL